jgi:hypothetical protein
MQDLQRQYTVAWTLVWAPAFFFALVFSIGFRVYSPAPVTVPSGWAETLFNMSMAGLIASLPLALVGRWLRSRVESAMSVRATSLMSGMSPEPAATGWIGDLWIRTRDEFNHWRFDLRRPLAPSIVRHAVASAAVAICCWILPVVNGPAVLIILGPLFFTIGLIYWERRWAVFVEPDGSVHVEHRSGTLGFYSSNWRWPLQRPIMPVVRSGELYLRSAAPGIGGAVPTGESGVDEWLASRIIAWLRERGAVA